MRWMVWLFVVVACEPRPTVTLDLPDARPPDALVSSDDRRCDVLAQTGCDPGQKCTWVVDPAGQGRIGCAPDQLFGLGDVCTWRIDLVVNYDDCKAGLVCDGYCDPICNPEGGAPACGAGHTCLPLGATGFGRCSR